MKNNFYVTTPIYYANDKPHIGHAYTTVAADVLARFHKLQKQDVFLLTGTDEHGLKIQKVAEKSGKNPQEFVDGIVGEYKKLWKDLNIEYSNFIRTTDENHKKAVQKVLQTLYDKSAIYKGEYEGLYCIGCEQFKNENELVDGKCPDHETVPEKLREECYLLKMTEKQKELIEKIEKNEFEIAPEKYKNEILSFLKSQALKDISISRKNVKWGIELPFNKEHTTYVWMEAFLNYLTGLGWDGLEEVRPLSAKTTIRGRTSDLDFWPPDVQLIGKDILRVHATIWPIMLLHLGLPLPKLLFTHGHILSGGKKMSKTLGNVITIEEVLEKFGVDGTRYLLLSAGTFGSDVDVTMERLIEKYNADLANGLGNLVSRFVKLNDLMIPIGSNVALYKKEMLEKMEFDQCLNFVWSKIRNMNKFIEDNKPWELAKTDQEKFTHVMQQLYFGIYEISESLIPFMPETSEKIKKALETKESTILFQRIK